MRRESFHAKLVRTDTDPCEYYECQDDQCDGERCLDRLREEYDDAGS